ncbi:lipocalin family protein [Yoonia litorea]|uniref:Outer membrane lipoprotein Blc n=1 Tax=Yoonia litorea TaxID=1123755 RepID=A0A1I6LFY7_9RHOB|nr:lipocalin family protein [Yoonia litorea]SFS02327.1 apolipoprotein D and lipocalin family protein [Yoonia litorea]
MRALVLAAFVFVTGCGFFTVYRDTDVPISSKAVFDVEQYMGLWYEVARFPVPFQRGCVGVTAEYALRDDGTVSVLNICRDPDGNESARISGTAEVVGPGRLKVRFGSVPFVAGDYWVLWTDEDYQTAVVGSPNGRSGWILNRTPQIRADRLQAARDILTFNGYDVSQLKETAQ